MPDPSCPASAPIPRKLTVSKLYRPKRREAVPSIRLNGVWLKRHGFDPGSRVQVTVRDGHIFISPHSL